MKKLIFRCALMISGMIGSLTMIILMKVQLCIVDDFPFIAATYL